MKNPTSALELLSAQHDEVDELFQAIVVCDLGDDKAEIFRELADKLAAHATVEERLFYPWVHTLETEGLGLASAEEHLAIKRVLADLLELSPLDPHFMAKLNVMRWEVRHHARDEEEDQLFPEVRELASPRDLAVLGVEMLAMYEDILESEPSRQIADETDRAAPV